MDYDDKPIETSSYNEASFQILRLHELWLKAEHYASKFKFVKWKYTLDAIWRELYADVIRLDDEENIKKNNKLKSQIANAKNKYQIHAALDLRHQFLKELQDSAGKGGVYVDKNREDFE